MSPRLLGALSLRGRLTLYVTLLSVVPLLTLNWLQTRNARRMLEEQIHASLLREAEGVKDLLEATLAERESSLRNWAEDSDVRSALRTGNTRSADVLLALLQRRYLTLNGIVLFNDEGHAVSASMPALRDAYAADPELVRRSAWFREARQGRTTGEGVTTEDPILGVRVLSLAVPVIDPASNHRLGVLMAAFDWAQVDELVRPSLTRASQRDLKSFALALRQPDGTVLYDSRGAQGGTDAELLAVSAVNGTDVKDVGDGWRFEALVSPDEAYAPVSRARTEALLLAAGFLALGVAGAWLLARGVTRPVLALRDAVTRLVRGGDLTQAIDVKAGNDEVGELADAFGQLVKQLRDTAHSLHRGTRVLSDTVAELQSAAAQQERNVARQAAALQETQVTAQEIKQTSMLAAQKAESVLSVAERADALAKSGEASIELTMAGLNDIRVQVGEIAQKIVELGERTQQIGGITQTVKDLADQSNMLALNAAIESVRSGEHGKGFGVVAREIRALADQSIQATTRVRELLDDIANSVTAAVRITERGAERMEAGLAQVRNSGQNLRELSSIVQDNAAAVRQIAAAVSQQNVGINQITLAVNDLSKMMDETVARIGSTGEAATTLQIISQQLSSAVKSYRVG
jgi:methyl-accepting chemotaxis protein